MPSFLVRLQNLNNDASLTALRQMLTWFSNNAQLAMWLESVAVKPFVDELVEGYLRDHPNDGEADFNGVAHHLHISNTLPLTRYRVQRPDKTHWSKFDHVTRFLALLIRHDKENQGICGWAEEEIEEVVTWQAYEVYAYVVAAFKEIQDGEEAAA